MIAGVTARGATARDIEEQNVRFVTDMFDAGSEQRIYTVESRTEYAQTTAGVILDETREIARRLRKDRVVR